MRLHRLEFTAIGPFAGTHVIDFTAFENSGIFLLEGPTGAGKSTIIDAIVFALYGDVARQRDSSPDRLRSDLVPAAVRSSVDLVFETSAGIFRVHRAPKYVPKGYKSSRNEPTTLVRVVEDPSASDGYQEVGAIERGAREVASELEHLIGLTKDQFLQTVVLPQGKFAQFLTASSQDRATILQEIFDTQVFWDLQERLKAASGRTRVEMEAAEGKVQHSFDELVTAAQSLGVTPTSTDSPDKVTPPDESTPPAEVNPLDEDPSLSLDMARELVESASGLYENAAAQLPERVEAERKKRQELEQAQLLNERLEQRALLLQELDALESQRSAIEQLRVERTNAAVAARIVPILDAHDTATLALATSTTTLEEALTMLGSHHSEFTELPQDGPDPQWSGLLRARVKAEMESLTEHRARIRDLVEREKGFPDRRAALKKREAERETLVQTVHTLGAQLASAPERIAAMDTQRRELLTELSKLGGAPARLKSVQDRLQWAQKIPDLEKARDACRVEERHARQAAHDAGAKAHAAHEAWLADTGAALACELEDGHPCPVCGSVEHPHPARPTQREPVSREQLNDFEKAKQRADNAFVEARSHTAQAHSALAAAIEAAGDSIESLDKLCEDARADIARSGELSAQVEVLDTELNLARQALESSKDEKSHLETQVATLTAEITALSTRLKEEETLCHQASEGSQSLGSLDARLSSALEAFDTLLSALMDWEGAHESSASTCHRAHQALVEAGLDTDETGALYARSLARSPQRLQEIDSRIDTFQARILSVKDQLASDKLRECESVTTIDCIPLEETLARLVSERDQAQQRLGFLKAGYERVHEAQLAFVEARDELDAARTHAGPICRLSAIAEANTAENLVSTPLSSWVLISRLDDVLAAANPRLLAISSGRYELVSTPDDGSRSRKRGLGITIVDHDTEEARSAKTLSGGETFYTSLALALGLADVVTAEAGGIELRTMFIDEGFGSLDSQTLDLVMTQLHTLKDSGRTVGVISHVEEMTQQIPDQIRIRPGGRNGSTLSIRV